MGIAYANLPQKIENSCLVTTMNKMGYMTSHLDPYSLKFIEFAKSAKNPLLEIGAAYGTVALQVLNQGARLIANDLDEQHLRILETNIQKHKRKNLSLLPGKFPAEIMLPKNSLDGIFMSRVIHFFSPQEIEESMNKFKELLVSGGKLVIISETPYLRDYKNFIPIFNKRKASGHKWPGLVEDVSKYAPMREHNIPKLLHFFDDETLSELLKKYEFDIEEVSLFKRPDYPPDLTLDGRESVGIIARKP